MLDLDFNLEEKKMETNKELFEESEN